MTDEQPPFNGNSSLSGADMLALLTRIDDMLGKMEKRIMDRLSDNAAGAADNWRKHDRIAAEKEAVANARFVVIEGDLLTVSNCLKDHLNKEHDEEVATQARVKPVKTAAQWLVANWKSILLALLALAGIFGWMGLETHIVQGP